MDIRIFDFMIFNSESENENVILILIFDIHIDIDYGILIEYQYRNLCSSMIFILDSVQGIQKKSDGGHSIQ